MRGREQALREREEAARKKLGEQLEAQAREGRKQIEGFSRKWSKKRQIWARMPPRRAATPVRTAPPGPELQEEIEQVVGRSLPPAQGTFCF